MIVYLAMIAPDHEGSQILGIFSTLELAQAKFSDAGTWDFNPRYRQWWQQDPKLYGIGYSDNEIHPIEVDAW